MFRTGGRSTARILLALLPLACGDGGKQAAGPEASQTEHQDAASVDGTVVSPDLAVADSAGPGSDTAPLTDTAAPDAKTGMGSDAAEAGGPAAACAPPADIAQPAARLSGTGCMDPADPRKLAASVVPYELNSPLWSDGAVKTRGMRLPAGSKIHVTRCATEPALCTSGAADDGKWVFPVGTVMVKSFLFDDKLVETRLFVRFDAATWVGYSYRWNEAQTDATIVPDERTDATFNTGKRTVDWTYPSRMDCTRCHLATAGSTLGPETAQLNRMVGGMNQLDRLQALGLLDAPLPKPYKAALVAPYVSESGAPPAGATLEQRARSYLHANCAFCHRPDAVAFPHFDLRYDVTLKDAKVCNTMPMKGDVGVPGSVLIKPGSAAESVMALRMKALPMLGRMPPLASKVVDQDAVKLVSDWIGSIPACPM